MRRWSQWTMTNNNRRWQTTRCIQHKSWHRPSHDHLRLKLTHGSSPVTSNTTDQHNTKTTTTMMLSRPWPRRTIVTRSQPQCEDDHNGQPMTMHVSPDITCVNDQPRLNLIFLSVSTQQVLLAPANPRGFSTVMTSRGSCIVSYNFYTTCPT